jgi:hypothetical protein
MLIRAAKSTRVRDSPVGEIFENLLASGNFFYFSGRFCISDADMQEKPTKRKRHQWTVKEKLDAVALFDKNQSKRETAKKKRVYNYSVTQIHDWIKNKENLFKM